MAAERVETEALLVRTVSFGEADVVATLVTEDFGLVAALARSARRSHKRFSALEPMHGLFVTFDLRPGADLAALVETRLERPRTRLLGSLDALDAAGTALRWTRRALAPRVPEPDAWVELNALLDELDRGELSARGALAAFGLRLLAALGWGLELERCVACGRSCADTSSARLDPRRGGLVCRACGGTGVILRPERRAGFLRAVNGRTRSVADDDVAAAIALVEAALEAHGGGAA